MIEIKNLVPILKIEQQIERLSQIFSIGKRNVDIAMRNASSLPLLDSFVPKEALPYTAWFAFVFEPRFTYDDIYYPKRYLMAKDVALHRTAEINQYHKILSLPQATINLETREVLQEIYERQGEGIIIIIAAQLGELRQNISVETLRGISAGNEYGLDILAGASIVTTHPGLALCSGLCIGLPGTNCGANIPFLSCWLNEISLRERPTNKTQNNCGLATFFSPY